MARKMKDSGIEWIGEIPEGWETQKLKYYATVTSGEILSKDEYVFSGDIPIIGSNGKIGTTYKSNNHSEVITTGRVGTIGTAQIVQDAWITDNALIIKSHSISRPFLTYVIPNFDFKFMLSGTAQPLITATKLKNQYIPVPSSEVQDKLVQYLNTQIFNLSHLISQVCSSIELYKKLKQAVITQAVTKGVRGEREMKDSGIEWIGEIPKEWAVQKIKSISSRINVGVVIRPSEYFDENGTVPFLRGINVKEYVISSDSMVYINESSNRLLSKSQVHTDDILIVRDGSIGTSCVVPAEYDGANVVSMVIVTPSISCDSRFICYSLNSDVGKTQFTLTKIGSALTHTSVSAVSDIIVAVPSCAEQKEIADYLDAKCAEIDKLIAKKEQLVKELESYKKSLIYEVVTGKREV